MKELTPRRVLGLIRRYRESYGSRLFKLGDVVAWVRALRSREPVASAAGSAVPLAFPSRVTITWTNGETSQAEARFPAGTFALATCEDTLRRKWIKTGGDAAAFELGLTLGAVSLQQLLAATLVTAAPSRAVQ